MSFVVRRLLANDEAAVERLSDILIDCVEGGASVGFMAPLAREAARKFWRRVLGEMEAGRRSVLVAESGGQIVGTVQLVFAEPENQPHRADVSKMLVPRTARRKGVGEALMAAVEAEARATGRTVLVLDTANADAERLYERSGWTRTGAVPGYALLPDGRMCDTVFYHRRLS